MSLPLKKEVELSIFSPAANALVLIDATIRQIAETAIVFNVCFFIMFTPSINFSHYTLCNHIIVKRFKNLLTFLQKLIKYVIIYPKELIINEEYFAVFHKDLSVFFKIYTEGLQV